MLRRTYVFDGRWVGDMIDKQHPVEVVHFVLYCTCKQPGGPPDAQIATLQITVFTRHPR
jgi:hypothetical protein